MDVERPFSKLPYDITSDILLRLPAEDVGRSRCVSKLFLSLTTEKEFIQKHYSITSIKSTGFYIDTLNDGRNELFLLNGKIPPSPTIDFLDFNGHMCDIIHSCNGLILCRNPEFPEYLSVCNNALKEHEVILVPEYFNFYYYNLAFDPRAPSLRYKLFGINFHVYGTNYMYSFTCFNSETQEWKCLPDYVITDYDDEYIDLLCSQGIYWNRCLCWNTRSYLLCLNVETEQYSRLMPPSDLHRATRKWMCVRECGDRLHCISTHKDCKKNSHFDIFMIESFSSGWSLLYKVNLENIGSVFPEAISTYGEDHLEIGILWFVYGEEHGMGDRLFLSIPRKVIVYDLKEKSYSTFCSDLPSTWGGKKLYSVCIHPHANTLFSLDSSRSHSAWVCWKSRHDNILLNLLKASVQKGHRTRLGFREEAWDDMIVQFNNATHLNYEVCHLKNRFETFKNEYISVNEIMKHPGFSWGPDQNIVCACNGGWSEFLKETSKETMVLYKRKKVQLEDLELICG